jgi:hypothetical protein
MMVARVLLLCGSKGMFMFGWAFHKDHHIHQEGVLAL